LISIDAESYSRGSDEIDGKSDGKNGTRRKKFYKRQRFASAVDDRVGVGGFRDVSTTIEIYQQAEKCLHALHFRYLDLEKGELWRLN